LSQTIPDFQPLSLIRIYSPFSRKFNQQIEAQDSTGQEVMYLARTLSHGHRGDWGMESVCEPRWDRKKVVVKL
jgi:hypothetical protein